MLQNASKYASSKINALLVCTILKIPPILTQAVKYLNTDFQVFLLVGDCIIYVEIVDAQGNVGYRKPNAAL